jgi:hypothetical protein
MKLPPQNSAAFNIDVKRWALQGSSQKSRMDFRHDRYATHMSHEHNDLSVKIIALVNFGEAGEDGRRPYLVAAAEGRSWGEQKFTGVT